MIGGFYPGGDYPGGDLLSDGSLVKAGYAIAGTIGSGSELKTTAPTYFGSSANANGNTMAANFIYVNIFTASASGTIDTARFYVEGNGNTAHVKFGVYSVSAGVALTLLGTSDQLTISPSDAPGLRTFTFTTPITGITNGTQYGLALIQDDSYVLYGDNSTGTYNYQSRSYGSGFTSPFSSEGSTTYTLSLEAGVSAAATVSTKSGFSSAGGIGAGSSASIFVDSGAGIAGLVGSSPSASSITQVGAGIVGTVGAGLASVSSAKTGTGLVGTIGKGVKVLIDLAPPVPTSATSTDTTVTLTFDELLDESSVPDPSQFDVKVNGVSKSVFSVTVSGSQVFLLMVDPIPALPVTVSYTSV